MGTTAHGRLAWHALGGGGGGAMNKIEEIAVSQPQATLTFSNIPQTYRSLMLTVYGRGDAAHFEWVQVTARFNGDAGANYDWQELVGAQDSVGASFSNGDTQALLGVMPAGLVSSTLADQCEGLIVNYANTTWEKTMRALAGSKLSTTARPGPAFAAFQSWWRSTAAISSITLFPDTGNFSPGTVATLYGLG
jgi:hypothetical protein